MNSVEQHVVVKGGSVCVFGTAEKGFQWSNLAGNYLLHRLCISKRNRKVLCVNFDQNEVSLKSNLSRNSSNDGDDSGSKLSTLNIDPFDELATQDGILTKIKSVIEDFITQDLSYSIVVYTLSELILSIGLKKAVHFVKELLYFVQSEFSKKNNGTTSQPSIVFIVHESLHSLAVLTQLQSLVSTIVKIVPNSGTLSVEVVAEMQTIRKSVTTGKIMECIEMFGYKDGLLYPMITNATSSNQTVEVVEDESTRNDNNSNNIMNKLLNNGSAASSSTKTATPDVIIDTTKRLITFDSEDPEFDEDSDPDADLDL